MKILFDIEENEILGQTERTLEEAVTAHIKDLGCWDDQYYGDGKISLTGKEYIKSGLYNEDFKLVEVTKIL